MTAHTPGPWSDPVTGVCPVAETLRLLGGKHGPTLLHCLTGGEMHFLELSRALGGISRKVLTEQLRVFEAEGLISRTPKQDARRRVAYALTPRGQALGAIIVQLYDWSTARV
ncbi:winged helix-turn-helix transcriptional regulator [Pararhodobacter zhoushanensis]|uniref:Helix-turn-helix transcriptional regulator n=1 Tax=Pararhodobacter zhoushanensis TaxID=2479545 RepID=A0ABT3GYZ4_9RHOB|nr:helix-turn-helix domain-containing protein [Pararhodobacter zhoushanensis]MCW1932752.1 helix-turn-helix transcriptional regulator [Pararhodobacter zhoushanensis]